jgi:V-type H+-transporting ATPase subunit D
MDENEREDFFRLKRLQEKMRIKKAQDELVKAEIKARDGFIAESRNILDADIDKDILF